jgi:DNA repair exonuclease SbcCD nuclease subunit
MTIRFLHTADLQLGKPFGQFPPEIAATLRAVRFDTLKRVALLGRDRGVDAVLVAGDCFDDIAVSVDTLQRFRVALEPFGGVWILLPGNHDPAIAESPWTRLRRFSLPRNVIIADEPKLITIGDKAVVLPAPLRRRRDAADLTDWFDTAVTEEEMIRIGLAHGSVLELLPQGSGTLNPVARDRAERARLDYLALGDWHGQLPVSERTWYSGTPEPDRFRSNESGYVLEVAIENPGVVPKVESVSVGQYSWINLEIELMPSGIDEIRDDIRRALGVPDRELERLVLRLGLRGPIDLATHAALDDFLSDLRARVFYLEDDDTSLTPLPTDDDLDSIDTRGFVRAAMNRLREQMNGPEAGTARRALALLYGLHHQGRR